MGEHDEEKKIDLRELTEFVKALRGGDAPDIGPLGQSGAYTEIGPDGRVHYYINEPYIAPGEFTPSGVRPREISTAEFLALQDRNQRAGGGGFSVTQTLLDPALIALQMQEREDRVKQNNFENALDLQKFTFLQGQEQYNRQRGNRQDALAAAQLQESINARIDQRNYQNQQLMWQAQQLQAQLDFQAQLANQQAAAQAEATNEQRRQANIASRIDVASRIGEAARAPGDIGKLAGFLQAGGASPVSTALGQGQTAITPESLVPLDLLLGQQEELNRGPQYITPQFVSAPRVPLPQFETSPALPALPGGQSAGGLNVIGTGATTGQAMQSAGLGGLSFHDLAGLTPEQIAGLQRPVAGMADGGFEIFTQPTTLNVAEKGPEAVAAAPLTSPQSGRAQSFMQQTLQRALALSGQSGIPTPVGVSAPGTNPWLQQLAAALAGVGRGIPPELYLNEARAATPMGLNFGGAVGRTR